MQVTFITHHGLRFEVKPSSGTSLMQAAVDSSVPGIVAECGGSCSCGTCRVVIGSEWQTRLPAPDPCEVSMLQAMGTVVPGLRLSCQIELRDEHDGLTVSVPESQY